MIKVRVPATTANIGSGFDCFGIALGLYNDFYIEEIDNGLEIDGCDEKYRNEDNLVYSAIKKCFEKAGYKYDKGIKILIDSEIPESRGLGSSASCILGGLIGANELMGGHFTQDEILAMATEFEGHPDNIAPALLGSAVISVVNNEKVHCSKVNVKENFKFCALIPNFTLSTEKARNALPDKVSYKDAVFNIGRIATMILALETGNEELVGIGCQDKLHQPYRGVLIRNYEKIVDECSKYSLGTFLSGAGPTIMNIINKENDEFIPKMKKFLDELEDNWEIKEFDIDMNGAFASVK